VVCGGGRGEVPTRLSCLGDPGSGAVLQLSGVHGDAAVLRRGALHGGGSFDVVRWAASTLLGFGRSTIVCT
jgi:hypothetical protein